MVDATKTDAEMLDELASRLNRCGVSRIDPERFHEERNDIVVAMRRMARRLSGQVDAKATYVWRAPGCERGSSTRDISRRGSRT